MGNICECDPHRHEIGSMSSKKSSQGSDNLNLKSFKILKVIGRGSFGKVMLVRKRDTKELFAMKVLKKD